MGVDQMGVDQMGGHQTYRQHATSEEGRPHYYKTTRSVSSSATHTHLNPLVPYQYVGIDTYMYSSLCSENYVPHEVGGVGT